MTVQDCISRGHTVVVEAVETTYAVYQVALRLDDCDEQVVEVNRRDCLDAEPTTPRLELYRCETCGTALPTPDLGVVYA